MSETRIQPSRRSLLAKSGMGAVALGAMAAGVTRSTGAAAATADIDVGILNFALNLEYLEAQFYLRGATGQGLPATLTGANAGAVKGGSKVPWTVPYVGALVNNIASDELHHVEFLVKSLGASAVPQPEIDFTDAFLAIGNLIGLSNFNPFHDQLSFLLGAFIFEDVGVTAYNGAAPLITSKAYLGYAASILAIEGYHSGAIRALLYEFGAGELTDRIAALRARAAMTGPGFGTPADDAGVLSGIAPTDSNALAFARTPAQVLSIVYAGGTTGGGFFPKGTNGMFTVA